VCDAGQRWYGHCVRVLREVDVAREDVGETQSVQGSLVVSAAITLGNALVVPKLRTLTKRHPRLSIDLRLEDRLVDLSGDAVDVAVRGGVQPPDSTRVVAHRLLSFRRFVVASPAYLSKHGTPRAPEDLSSHACLIQLREWRTWPTWHLVLDGAEQRVPVHGALRTNAPLAIRELARGGAGVALLPEWLVERDLAEKRLRRVLGAWSSQPVIVWAIHRSELRGSPRVRAFVDAMRAGA
jgi:DNA-binding transcriptional LysR family regulator